MDLDPGSKEPLLQQQHQSTHQQGNTQSRSNLYAPQRSQQQESDQYATTRLDTLASYGQLVTPHTFDDAPNVSQHEIRPQREAQTNEAGPSSSTSLPHAHTQGRRPQISVTDPVKHTEKSLVPGVSGSYVTYTVTSRMTLPKYSSRGASVRRRFRDFVVSTCSYPAEPHKKFLPLLVIHPRCKPFAAVAAMWPQKSAALRLCIWSVHVLGRCMPKV